MSTILCIIDGMTDSAFDFRRYPALSAMRLMGYIQTTPEGYDTESLNCILTLLGVREIPRHIRGYVEALGAGIAMQRDDIALRLSWFSTRGDCLACPVPAPSNPDIPEGVLYYNLGGYKSLLILPGQAAHIDAIRIVPPYRFPDGMVEAFRPSGNVALTAFFDKQRQFGLCAVPWGQSCFCKMPPFPAEAAVICGTGIVRGIARLLRMESIEVEGATGDTDTDLERKVCSAMDAAERYELVVLHMNGADEAAHRKSASEKDHFLRKVDTTVIASLLRAHHDIFVVSDHGSDPANGLHIGAAQPIFTNSIGDCIYENEKGSLFPAQGMRILPLP